MAFKDFIAVLKNAAILNISWDSKHYKILNKIFLTEHIVLLSKIYKHLKKELYTQIKRYNIEAYIIYSGFAYI